VFSQIPLKYDSALINPTKPDELFYSDIGQEIIFLSELIQIASGVTRESPAVND
jgi:hypothetical protein